MAQDDIPPLDEYDLDDDSSEEYDIDEDGEDLVVPTPLASYDVPDEKPEEHDLSFDEERIPEYSPLDRYRDNLSDDKERNKILEDVLRDQARREVLRDIAYRRPAPSLRARVVALVLALVALGMWWLPIPGLSPAIGFPLAPTAEEAGLRLAAYVQAQQVEAFRRTTGRLPDLLRETGEPVPGVDYQRLDARTYLIANMSERDTIRWLSSDSFPALLGDSAATRLRAIVR